MQANRPIVRTLLPALLAVLLLAPSASAQTFNFSLGGGDSFSAGGPTDEPVKLDARVDPAADGKPAMLVLTANIEQGWHVYAITQPAGGPQKTKIELEKSDQYQLAGPFTAQTDYEVHHYDDIWKGVEVQEHYGQVIWTAPIEITGAGDASSVAIRGTLRGQACDEVCLPISLTFAVNADATAAPTTPVSPTAPLAAAGGYDLTKIQLGAEQSFGYYLYWAFIGGLALNLMPCVLPVIGLKVMSFVGQAGKSRLQAFALNMWYAFGILAVFWVLAALAITLGYRWSDQAGSPLFNVGMSALVMAMGLSLLGVWEIPIPGFLGSNSTQMAASKEGAFGAWLKGVITTLLAIPCTGPGMAVALGWAVGKEWPAVAAVFTAIGLGMASPYLVIGAFPGLVKFLPKPGAWMETFKQLMGFVLMGTVVFLLSLLPADYVIPTLALLTAIGLACWVYASTPITASSSDKWQSYALCGAILLGASVLSFGWLQREVTGPRFEAQVASAVDKHLAEKLLAGGADSPELASLLNAGGGEVDGDWGAFSLQSLGTLAIDRGKTVLVDFGAEWCLTCKTLESTVLHTEPVEQAIAEAGVATLYADYTETPPEIKAMLESLRSQSVPVVAIFPADDPYHPIVFRGGYTQAQLIEAIGQATGGPIATVASKN